MIQRRLVETSSERWRKLVLPWACAERERFEMGVHIEGTGRGFGMAIRIVKLQGGNYHLDTERSMNWFAFLLARISVVCRDSRIRSQLIDCNVSLLRCLSSIKVEGH